jgi:FG-GAP-like repeat
MEVADLNGDGKPDLLLVEFAADVSSPAELTVLLNDGTGKFLPPVRTSITGDATVPVPVFVAGAFRNPATPDVIYMNTYNEGNSGFNVLFLRGNGDGTFASPVTLAALPSPQQVVAGDFNNDGKLDFAVVEWINTDTGPIWQFNTFLGHGDGTFTPSATQRFPFQASLNVQQLFALDLNHDGKLDLLIGMNGNLGWEASGDDLIEALGNGDGTFRTPTTLISHFGAVAVADVNHDGYLDLIQARDPNSNFGQALTSQPGVTVYLASADGTFRQQPSCDLPGVAFPPFNAAMVGDFNGDGIPDIAVNFWPVQQNEYVEPSLRILQGVGDGTFIVTDHTYQLAAFSQPLLGADFNGDGATDLMELTASTSSYTTIPAAPAPALDISLDSSPVLGSTGRATVALGLPAGSAETVTLSASDPAIQLPPSLQFNAGEQTQDVAFTLGSGFDANPRFRALCHAGRRGCRRLRYAAESESYGGSFFFALSDHEGQSRARRRLQAVLNDYE